MKTFPKCSVADPGCLSRIPDPKTATKERGIPDPKTATKERGKNYFSFAVLKKKIWANFQRIIELFTQKIVTKLSKIWVWDPGSGIWIKPIPDPGSRGQKGIGSRILDPDPQHCQNLKLIAKEICGNCVRVRDIQYPFSCFLLSGGVVNLWVDFPV
jgi:hypothetical protein